MDIFVNLIKFITQLSCLYIINMKSNPIMIIKHDQTKKRSGPIDLKRKIGSLPSDLPAQHYITKI